MTHPPPPASFAVARRGQLPATPRPAEVPLRLGGLGLGPHLATPNGQSAYSGWGAARTALRRAACLCGVAARLAFHRAMQIQRGNRAPGNQARPTSKSTSSRQLRRSVDAGVATREAGRRAAAATQFVPPACGLARPTRRLRAGEVQEENYRKARVRRKKKRT
jgi:hypothetical protein